MSGPSTALLRQRFERASAAWNKDNGSHEQTVKCGEELYFAAHFLIDRLTEEQSA